MARRRERFADESGFSLVELLVALTLGSVVLTVAMTLFVNGLTATTRSTDRVEALQGARLTLDRMTTLLQAQVCASGATPITDAQPNTVTFTANVGDVSSEATRYTLRWNSATRQIFEDRAPAIVAADGGITFPSAPTSTRLIGSNVVPDGSGMFSYYKFDPVAGGLDTDPLTFPIAATDAQRVVAVGVDIVAQPERTKTSDPRSTAIGSRAVVGSADSADPNKGPKC